MTENIAAAASLCLRRNSIDRNRPAVSTSHRPSAATPANSIRDFPPVVQRELIRDGRLVEVMPEGRFRPVDLLVVHSSTRHLSRPVRLFTEFAAQVLPTFFPTLPI
jgi:hypothetical protein